MQTERSLHHFMFDHLRSVRFNPTSVITPLTAWFSAKKKYICHKTYISISSKTFFFVRDLSPSTKNSPWHHKYIYRFIHSAQCCSPTLTNIELPRQILIKSPQCPKCFGESPQSSVSLHTNIWNLLKYNTLQFFFSMALTTQSRAMASSFLRFFEITHSDTLQSVGLLWTSDQPVSETSTWQHSQQTNIHTPGRIRTHKLSRRAAADLRLRPRGHWDRQIHYNSNTNYIVIFLQLHSEVYGLINCG